MPPKKKKSRWTAAQKAEARKRRARAASAPKGKRSTPRPEREDRRRSQQRRPRADERGPRRDGEQRRPRADERGPRRDGEQRRPRRDERGPRREERAPRRAPVAPDPEEQRKAADTWTKAERRRPAEPVTVTADNGFAALGVPPVLVERLARDGITAPFAIQEAAIPDALAGKDVLGRGRTGSGKTLAFGLPVLARLTGGRSARRAPRALVLVPTRELAMQVSDALEPLAHVSGIRHKLIAGGLSYTGQIGALDKGVDLLVATPGRLVDLLDRGALTLGDIEVAVLDEADHMADMGFLPSVTRILDECAPGGQRLLFSATLDRGVGDLVETYLSDPVTHSTDDATASVTTMEHHLLLIDPQHKKELTARIASRPGRTVLFARTKLGSERIARQLRESGVHAAALHGGLTQSVRNKVIGAFRTGRIPVLVATDVAARGIHVDDVSLVLQIDPPADHKDYLHRAGRTARAGHEGAVVTLVLPHQRREVTRMAELAGIEARPSKAAPGDPVLQDLGAREPSGEPVDEREFKSLVDPKPARRAHGGRNGGRGPRDRGGDRRRKGQAPLRGGRPRQGAQRD